MLLVIAKLVILAVVLTAVVAIVVVVLLRKVIRKKSASGLPDTGVEFVWGRVGSGKTFVVTRWIIDVILNDRRAVYTNLPLRFGRVRAYLRVHGGKKWGVHNRSKLVRLIVPLTKEHFVAFCDRQVQKKECRDERRKVCYSKGEDWDEVGFQAWFISEYEPDRLEGRIVDGEFVEGNWIPPNAVVAIDEVHEWFPNPSVKGNTGVIDPPSLDRYLAMVRHHGHLLWIITQYRTRATTKFRHAAAFFWEVRRLGETRIWAGMRYATFGVDGFQYFKRTPEQENALRIIDQTPSKYLVIFHWLPKYKIIFSMYQSVTHQGTAEEQAKQERKFRSEAGFIEDHKKLETQDNRKEDDMFKILFKFAFVIIFMFVAFIAGIIITPRLMGPLSVPGLETAVELGNSQLEAAKNVPTVVGATDKDWPEGMIWKTIASDGVMINDTIYKIGENKNEMHLLQVNIDKRISIWGFDDYIWMWRYGIKEPRRVCTREFLFGVLAGIINRDPNGRSLDTDKE